MRGLGGAFLEVRQEQVHVGAVARECLHADVASEVLRVQPCGGRSTSTAPIRQIPAFSLYINLCLNLDYTCIILTWHTHLLR